LPTEIGKLLNLQTLDLSYNQFTSLPIEMSNLVNLRFLSVGNNPPEKLLIKIKNLMLLKWLYPPKDLVPIKKIKKLLPECNVTGLTDST